MTKLLKASLLSVGILSVMGLTACQSTPQSANAKQQMHQKGDRYAHHGDRKHWQGHSGHHEKHMRMHKSERTPLTAEQRAEFEKKRTERLAQHQAQRDAITKACEGKAGQKVSLQVSNKTIEGTCEVQFRPTRPERLNPRIQKEVAQPIAPQSAA